MSNQRNTKLSIIFFYRYVRVYLPCNKRVHVPTKVHVYSALIFSNHKTRSWTQLRETVRCKHQAIPSAPTPWWIATLRCCDSGSCPRSRFEHCPCPPNAACCIASWEDLKHRESLKKQWVVWNRGNQTADIKQLITEQNQPFHACTHKFSAR